LSNQFLYFCDTWLRRKSVDFESHLRVALFF